MIHCHIRIVPLLLAFALLTGCERALPGRVDAIELTGGTRMAKVNRDGSGYFYSFGMGPREKFAITPQAFRQLKARLVKYRRLAIPTATVRDPVCSPGRPHVMDTGIITIRWTGAGIDDAYVVDRGCDKVRNADRNRDLLAILDTLPVPKTPGPFPY